MNRADFLSELREKLKRLPQDEIDAAVNFYDEYFNDAGIQREQNVIDELVSPSAVASKIIGEYAVSDAEIPRKRGFKPLWIVILAVFASPVAVPLACAAFIVVLSLFIVFISFVISGAAMAFAGIAAIIAGLWALHASLSTGMFFVGYGLFTIAAGTAAFMGTVKLSRITFSGIQKLLGRFLIRRGSK